MTKKEASFVESVRAYANEHYDDGGWDVIVECWSDEQIASCRTSSPTKAQAFRTIKAIVAVFADREADARNSAF